MNLSMQSMTIFVGGDWMRYKDSKWVLGSRIRLAKIVAEDLLAMPDLDQDELIREINMGLTIAENAASRMCSEIDEEAFNEIARP